MLRHLLISSILLTALHFTSADVLQTRSAKRGLVYVPSSDNPEDDQIWISNNSDLTWYYNYQQGPSPAYINTSLEFVPMLWGAPISTADNSFLMNVTGQVLNGANITAVMSFNEPDGTTATGGSNVDPTLAASTWIREILPLRKLGLLLGAPAVTGANSGFTWLQEFFDACGGNCTADFIPVHWYGDFSGLASHIGQIQATYPQLKVWVTEFALEDSDLADSQVYFNTSCEYFDRLENITRYSYFGAFRSDVSNIGPNATMLTSNGLLTDIGSWYLGGNETGNIPEPAEAQPSNTSRPALGTPTNTNTWG